MNSSVRASAVAVSALALTLGFAPAAFASGGGGVERSGMCSSHSTWKLKAKAEDRGRLEVEYEVDSNVVGQTWRVRLADNGRVFLATTRRTVAPSGSFEVHARTANRAGTDVILATARNAATGETCTGRLRI